MEREAHGTVFVIVRRMPMLFDERERGELWLEGDKLEVEVRRG
jgi:hypothetical protein